MRRGVALAGSALGVAVLAGALILLAGDGSPQAARTAGQQQPAPGDPLTPEEVGRASEIANRRHMAGGRVELLYVERDDDKAHEGDRRAAAYFYDYARDTLVVRTVDLGRGEVVAESKAAGAQPPPSRREEVVAAELLLADPRLGRGVRAEYARAAGRPLRSASDLGLRGLIFRGGPCRTHRCVRLFVRLPDERFLDTSRIVVDLSAKKIHTLEW
ncbi:hypothetical protein [Thermoactinospora rubra]|uniref:hypothetical protein n=1 Tax=Thermoactinospora rubra TaxID=1088767 RepID=UPI000A11D343|nr:hypothetical protein [Thermoactinospora rubra]